MPYPKILATKTRFEIRIMFIWALGRPWMSSNPRYYQKMMSKPRVYHKSLCLHLLLKKPSKSNKKLVTMTKTLAQTLLAQTLLLMILVL
jgi:hypothetical protein